jgi:hypothetical protein
MGKAISNGVKLHFCKTHEICGLTFRLYGFLERVTKQAPANLHRVSANQYALIS